MKTLIPTLMTAIILTACTSPAEKPQPSQPVMSSEKPSEPRQASTPALAAKWFVVSFDRFGGQNGFFGFEQNAQGAWQDGLQSFDASSAGSRSGQN